VKAPRYQGYNEPEDTESVGSEGSPTSGCREVASLHDTACNEDSARESDESALSRFENGSQR